MTFETDAVEFDKAEELETTQIEPILGLTVCNRLCRRDPLT